MWVGAVIISQSVIVAITSCCIISIEWLTMMVTQFCKESSDQHWKERMLNHPYSMLTRLYFRNNFRNLIGSVGIVGLYASPILTILLFEADDISSAGYLYKITIFFLFVITCVGRIISLLVELSFNAMFFYTVLQEDSAAMKINN